MISLDVDSDKPILARLVHGGFDLHQGKWRKFTLAQRVQMVLQAQQASGQEGPRTRALCACE